MTPFEYHFTFDFSTTRVRLGVNEESWRLFCAKFGWKPLTIDNYKSGRIASRHIMASFDHFAEENEWHDNTMTAIEMFCKEGFIPIRVKVEKKPDTSIQSLQFGEYYETHMKIRTDEAPKIFESGTGISKNIIKDYFLITCRTDDDFSNHLFDIDEIKDTFSNYGINPFDLVTEHCILDTNIGMDNDWLRM